MKRLVIATVLTLLVACGPSYNGPEIGLITDKPYDDPDRWTTPGYYVPPVSTPGYESCSGGYGSQPRTCTRTSGIYRPGYWVAPVDHYDGPHYFLTIAETDTPAGKKRKVDDVEVELHIYDKADVGQCYDTETKRIFPTETGNCK